MNTRYATIKMQVSIGGEPGTLVYTKDRRYMNQFDRSVGEEFLGDDLKGYFKAKITTKKLEILKRVNNKYW